VKSIFRVSSFYNITQILMSGHVEDSKISPKITMHTLTSLSLHLLKSWLCNMSSLPSAQSSWISQRWRNFCARWSNLSNLYKYQQTLVAQYYSYILIYSNYFYSEKLIVKYQLNKIREKKIKMYSDLFVKLNKFFKYFIYHIQ
jgi:hypothetical protein